MGALGLLFRGIGSGIIRGAKFFKPTFQNPFKSKFGKAMGLMTVGSGFMSAGEHSTPQVASNILSSKSKYFGDVNGYGNIQG